MPGCLNKLSQPFDFSTKRGLSLHLCLAVPDQGTDRRGVPAKNTAPRQITLDPSRRTGFAFSGEME